MAYSVASTSIVHEDSPHRLLKCVNHTVEQRAIRLYYITNHEGERIVRAIE